MPAPPRVHVVIESLDVDVLPGFLRLDGDHVEFVANIEVLDRSLVLRALHVYGAGPHTLGLRAIRGAVEALMEELDVDEIVIEGGTRVTGAAAGPSGSGPRTPKRLRFRRERS